MSSLVERLAVLKEKRNLAAGELALLKSQLEEVTKELALCGVTEEMDLQALKVKCEGMLAEAEQKIVVAEEIMNKVK